MNSHITSLGFKAILSTSALALTLGLAGAAHAQVTTSEVRGFVTDSSSFPVSGARVTLTNTATGLTRSARSDSSGNFAVRNLPVSGLYNVTVSADGYQGERVEDIALSLGGTTALNFSLDGGQATDEIIVVGQRQVLADLAVGPSATFGSVELENAPAINRNIADVIRLDPRVFVDESRGDINSVQCVGQNSRFNSLTVDGVALNDSFGLNSNGFPTERQPFPYEILDQVSVEIAPFDVKYGSFTACNINAVTKSGTNELHGGAFVDYTNDGLRGNKAKNTDVEFDDFDEYRYGFDIGGPIVKDKLFFYAAYEKLEGANTYDTSVVGNGPFQVTQADLDEIAQISRDIYQYDPGFTPSSFANRDEKIFLKLDWNINEAHRASFSYNYNDGFNTVRSDGDSNEFEFSNHLYERGTKLDALVGSIYSDWTENFSTEVRVGYLEVDNRQESIGGTDFGEIRVEVGSVDVYLGSDDSRQANDLNYDLLDLSFRGNYNLNNHNILFGAERKDLNVFNLFIQQAETEIRFRGIDDFRNGDASQIEYNNAPSQNPTDAAAVWGYALNSIYAQDEFTVGDDLTIVAGLRYDWYSSDDTPTENPGFVADYGFSNAQNFDGVGLLQPRVGFTWDATDEIQVHGGVGRYSGGNPNVWLSNNYSSNNVTQVGARERGINLFDQTYVLAEDGVPNGPGYAVPQILADAVATGQGRNFEINYLDPDFTIPSEYKFAVGATWAPSFDTGEDLFGGDWFFQADLLYTKAENTAIITRGDLVEVGTRTVSGTDDSGVDYNITVADYDSPLVDSFSLTNADINNKSFVASFGLSKEWESGWGWRFGYAYSDAKDVQPMTSSVAFSNYNNRAYTNPQEQILSTSNYNIKHRFTSAVSYRKDFWEDYDTGIFAFFQSSSGRPYSRTLDGQANDLFGFTPFLGNGGNSVLLPGTERNEFTSPSWTKVDLKITQDLPGLRENDRTQVFMVIDNLTNLINSDWGVLEQGGFPRTLVTGQPLDLIEEASVYEIRFGANYTF